MSQPLLSSLRTVAVLALGALVAGVVPAHAETAVDANSTPVAAHVRANAEHPAVVAWRQAQSQPRLLDPNHMMVQPPASVTWTVAPDNAFPSIVRSAQR